MSLEPDQARARLKAGRCGSMPEAGLSRPALGDRAAVSMAWPLGTPLPATVSGDFHAIS